VAINVSDYVLSVNIGFVRLEQLALSLRKTMLKIWPELKFLQSCFVCQKSSLLHQENMFIPWSSSVATKEPNGQQKKVANFATVRRKNTNCRLHRNIPQRLNLC
jgi:hypothetical protein